MYLCTLPDTIGWSNRLDPSCCGVLEAKSLLGMRCHKMSLLHSDVYSTLSPDYRKQQTTYILQTLWRDLTSDFDVIGPHFTNDATIPHHFLCSILMESIYQFHICGFEVVEVVCDGASSNMTMIKEMSGAERKAYR